MESGVIAFPEAPLSEKLDGLQEIGRDAVWLVSTAKSGFGVDQLYEQDPMTYWQSDGILPHVLTIQFPNRCRIAAIALFAVNDLDQSYTPFQISVRVGTTWNDADTIGNAQIGIFHGWEVVDLRKPDGDCPFASLLQLVIHSNLDEGRDSHLRGFKIYGPASHTNAAPRITARLR